MAYHALRPCRLGGTTYKIGDKVPSTALVEGTARRLIAFKVLACTQDPTVEDPVLIATVTVDGAETEVAVDQDGMDLIVSIMTATVDAAAPLIADATDADVLTLISALESRSGVKSAITTRLAALALEETPEG